MSMMFPISGVFYSSVVRPFFSLNHPLCLLNWPITVLSGKQYKRVLISFHFIVCYGYVLMLTNKQYSIDLCSLCLVSLVAFFFLLKNRRETVWRLFILKCQLISLSSIFCIITYYPSGFFLRSHSMNRPSWSSFVYNIIINREISTRITSFHLFFTFDFL